MKFSKNDMINYAAILVIVVSMASIGMQLTGFLITTDTAVVNVTITDSAAINFTVNVIDFGAGAVTSGQTNATLETGVAAGADGTWSGNQPDLVLENIGNVNVSLGFLANVDADDFLGGTNPEFQFRVDATGESGACSPIGTWTDFLTTNQTACTNFPFADAMDEIALEIRLVIPNDATPGTHSATITATGFYL